MGVLTLLMFPVLVWMYVRLAKNEEREAREQFGKDYDQYTAVTPAFIPHVWKPLNDKINQKGGVG